MSYINANKVLPTELLEEVQKYVCGGLLYIPQKDNSRVQWGSSTDTKKMLARRNEEICKLRKNGMSIQELMEAYHLSYDSIRRVLYKKL